MSTINRQILLASRPKGEPSAENFKLVETPVAPLADGQVLVRHHFLSLDPYMRGRMSDAKSYAAPQPLDARDDRRHRRRGGRVEEPALQGRRQGGGHGRLAGIRRRRRRPARRAAEGRHDARAAVGLPRRGGHARRHRLVRPRQDHRARRPARRWSSAPRPARSAARWASSPRRAAPAWWASPAARTSAARWWRSSASTSASTTASSPT